MGELLALRWRDVDFAVSTIRVRANYYLGQLTTPKSGKVRAVPLAPDVASALAQLERRENWVGDDDLVFAGEAGGYLDGSALRRRYKEALARAGLRPLRFHDLRHTFGTRMIGKADIRRVQEWMGHADIQTTMRYLHYAPRREHAGLVAEALAVQPGVRAGRLGTSWDVNTRCGVWCLLPLGAKGCIGASASLRDAAVLSPLQTTNCGRSHWRTSGVAAGTEALRA
jgi:hypothetical protein